MTLRYATRHLAWAIRFSPVGATGEATAVASVWWSAGLFLVCCSRTIGGERSCLRKCGGSKKDVKKTWRSWRTRQNPRVYRGVTCPPRGGQGQRNLAEENRAKNLFAK